MTTEEKYRPVVIRAILDLAEMEERPLRGGRTPVAKNYWFTVGEVFDYIHNHHGDRGWQYRAYYQRGGRRTPSPGRELVSKIVNKLRQEGLLEYNPDSLGKTSEWRIPSLATTGDSYSWNAKRLEQEILEIDESP